VDGLQGYGALSYEKQENYADIRGVGADDLGVIGVEVARGSLDLVDGSIILGASAPENFYSPNARPGEDRQEALDLLGKKLVFTLTKYTSDGEESRKILRFRVAGILKQSSGEADWSAYITMRDAEKLNQWWTGKRINRDRNGYQRAVVLVKDSKKTMSIAKQIGEKGYQTITAQSFLKGINSFFLILQLIFGGIGAISLFVAAIGISNTMAMAILERTREIGLMKAIGATNRDVLTIFLGEAGGIGFLGGVGGALLGWSVDFIIGLGLRTALVGKEGLDNMTVVTPSIAILLIILFSTLVGVLSGVYPALRAATLVPVEALRTE
jgi:putative ABC transport system permease protein